MRGKKHPQGKVQKAPTGAGAKSTHKGKTLVEVFMEEKVKALLADIERKSALGEIK